jgi:MFS family permease
MTDRSRDDAPDDNLDYLDAGLPPDDQATTRIDPDRPPGTGRSASTAPPVSPPPPIVHTSETATARSDSSWTWPLTNLIGLIVVIAVNYSANYFEFNGNSTGDIVNRDPVPFQPAGWVFSIWGVIYLLLAVFVVYGLLPAGRHNQRLQRISPLFLITNIANTVWIIFWHWEQVAASLGTMVVLLVALLGIYIGVRYHGSPFRRATREAVDKPGWFERIALRLPFSVYIGWICVALLANVMVWLDQTGRDSGLFSLNWWAVIFMVVATLVAAVFMVTSHDGVVALVMAVAFAGIADRNWGTETAVSVVAGIFAVLALVIAVVSALIAFDKTHNRPLPGSHLWRRTEPVA